MKFLPSRRDRQDHIEGMEVKKNADRPVTGANEEARAQRGERRVQGVDQELST